MPNQFRIQESFDRPNQEQGNGNLYSMSQSSAIAALPGEAPVTPTSEPSVPQDDWSGVTQELVDALPSPWTRGLLHALLGFMAIGLPWSMVAKVDETGSARGRLEPKGQAVRLDAAVSGTVVDINVKEGQTVKAGQVLVRLDSELTKTELLRAQAELDGHTERLTQLQLMENQLQIAVGQQQLQSQAQQAAQLAQIDQTQKQLYAAINAVELAKTRLGREQAEVDRFVALLNEGVVPQVKVVEVQRLRDDSLQQLNQAQAQIEQSQSELVKQQSNYEEIKKTGELAVLQVQQQLDELQSNIASTRAAIAQAQKQIQSLELQLQQRVLRAPTDGTVFQMAVQNPGSVVQPGQELIHIAPKGVPLVFRAQMPSQETGFLKLDAPVKLKFDAYPFQDYGVIPGRLRWIAPDSKIVETPQGKTEVFEVEVVLEQNSIQDQNQSVILNAGQSATAEVVIRQRRVIDFVLDPFKKLQKGGLEL
jgi:HlyD family secretion protein